MLSSLIKKIAGRAVKLVVAVVILGAGFALYNLLVETRAVVEPQPRQEVVNRVRIIPVVLQDARPIYVAYGTVEATRKADLRFSIAGEIDRVSAAFRNGAIVRKGDELAMLDRELLIISRDEIREQLTAEEINIASLETQLELRQRQFDRISQMKAASVATEARLDDTTLALTQAMNALSQSRSRMKQLKLAIKRADRNLRDTRLLAPFSGVLSSVDVGVGKVISSTTPLGVITDINNLEVSFVVPAEVYAEAGQLKGDSVTVIWKAGGRSVLSVRGKIIRSEGSVSAAEGGGRLYASLPSGNASQSIPEGAFVEVRIASLPLSGVAVLPDTAIFDNDTVFVIMGERSETRTIEVLARSEGLIYVRGDLRDGDNVITTRIPGLGDGVLVEAVGQ